MTEQQRWKIYEKRWKWRDFYFHKVLRRHIFEPYFKKDIYIPYYAHRFVMTQKQTNDKIANMIQSGKPFMVSRFGNTELSLVVSMIKIELFGNTDENKGQFYEWFDNLNNLSGFFPQDISLADRFKEVIIESAKETDILAEFHCRMDDYMIDKYIPDAKITFLNHIEPWRTKNPWTRALKGKKVLVIHPFEDTIIQQYSKRDKLFDNNKVLPEFQLYTLKAVQTLAGNKDSRFDNWFQALEYMYNEAMKIDFDIAIIGCGAYGMPLAAMLKKAGKQAIHMGGATQILFGIKGRRWVDNPRCGVKFNDYWVYPNDSEKPSNSNIVENNCYW